MSDSDTNVTAFLQVKNEDYWIELLLRVACPVFREVLVMDNGSVDKTPEILTALRDEGLRFQVVQYDAPWVDERGMLSPVSTVNAVKNAAIREHVRSRWIYVIDGDEIQYEETCRAVAESVRAGPSWLRGLVNFQFTRPGDFFSVTRQSCVNVRSWGGRLFDFGKVQWKEPGYDHFEMRSGLVAPGGSVNDEKTSYLIPGAVVLHAALARRSTLSSWQGANDPAFRRNYSSSHDEDYESLTLFPKEALQCRHSDHNDYFQQVLRASGIRYI